MFDSGAATIVLVIIGIIALPIMVYSLKKRNKAKKLMTDFKIAAEKAKITISRQEIWKNSYIIGLDATSGKLLYIHNGTDKNEVVLIDLSEVDNCRVVSYNKTSGGQAGGNNNSDRIELVLSYRKQGLSGKVLEFYDNKEFMPTADDFAIAEKWHKAINQALEMQGNQTIL